MKKILIDFIPTPIGDLISAVPYFDKYREQNNIDLFISISNIDLSYLFVTTYPLLNFVTKIDTGKYDDKIIIDYNFSNKKTKSIQSNFAEELGFEDAPYIRPNIVLPMGERKIKSKYVSMGVHSTLQYKYWNHPSGKRVQPESPNWNELCGLIRKSGYTPVVLEKDEMFGVSPFRNGLPRKANKKVGQHLIETINYIYHSEFYIGLSSGMSWVAHALGKPVVMISNFTEDWNEFDLSIKDYKRITNKSVCHGCFNNHDDDFYLKSKNSNDWYSCPRHRDTNRQFECHTSITPEMVYNEIKDWLK
jgi:autotransporter strand-loop-strand O-heptosyltransferase